MATSASQIVQPTIVNFVPAAVRQFQTSQLTRIVEEQDRATFESVDTISLSQAAKNFQTFFNNPAADFAVEEEAAPTFNSEQSYNFVAFKLFERLDVPASSSVTVTDKKVTANEVREFLDKADFFLNKVGVLNPESEVTLNQFVYFGTKLNEILQELESSEGSLNIREFTDLFKSKINRNRVIDFDKVLKEVIDIAEDTRDKPVVFQAFI